jgi:hypothetical protein
MKHKGMGNIFTVLVKKSQRHKLMQENLKTDNREVVNPLMLELDIEVLVHHLCEI